MKKNGKAVSVCFRRMIDDNHFSYRKSFIAGGCYFIFLCRLVRFVKCGPETERVKTSILIAFPSRIVIQVLPRDVAWLGRPDLQRLRNRKIKKKLSQDVAEARRQEKMKRNEERGVLYLSFFIPRELGGLHCKLGERPRLVTRLA